VGEIRLPYGQNIRPNLRCLQLGPPFDSPFRFFAEDPLITLGRAAAPDAEYEFADGSSSPANAIIDVGAGPNASLPRSIQLRTDSRRVLMVIAQEPTWPLATQKRILATSFPDSLEQEDVALALMISLGMIMLNIFFHRPSHGAFAKESDLIIRRRGCSRVLEY
jgi:hypothetical protein